MRGFFILAHDDRDDLQAVSDYEMCDFDPTVFWSGKPFHDTIPKGVKLLVGDGKPSDYLGNPISWAIFSERFFQLVRNMGGNDMQCFPAPVYHEASFERSTAYSVINVTRCVDALARPLTSIQELVLAATSIPADVHFFRLVGHETVLLVSQELFYEIQGKRLRGVAFVKTKCI